MQVFAREGATCGWSARQQSRWSREMSAAMTLSTLSPEYRCAVTYLDSVRNFVRFGPLDRRGVHVLLIT